jgi:hypothetical protein
MLLDQMRLITANIKPNQKPDAKQEAALQHTYQQLEQYLAEKDPVRRYPKQELRELIRNKLHLSGPVFFDTL